jgi:hypothetical protein
MTSMNNLLPVLEEGNIYGDNVQDNRSTMKTQTKEMLGYHS